MSRFTAWIALLILIGSVWSQEQLSDEEFDERSPRFGFDLDPIRKFFCNSSCMSSETMPYLLNLACAVKCPELYLPHGTSTTVKSEKPNTDTTSTTATPPSDSSSTTTKSSEKPSSDSMPTTTKSSEKPSSGSMSTTTKSSEKPISDSMPTNMTIPSNSSSSSGPTPS